MLFGRVFVPKRWSRDDGLAVTGSAVDCWAGSLAVYVEQRAPILGLLVRLRNAW
jgi:hypothetical protein